MKKLLFFPFSLLVALHGIGSCEIQRRAAFDIGSGRIKLQVSDVDIKANKIVNVLLTDTAEVSLREDLGKSLERRLSPEIQNQAVKAIAKLMEKAAALQPEACHAVATEGLRFAVNGEALVERIEKETGVPVTIISQEEEGILGFLSAVNETDMDLEKAVAWDFGGGSFQITAKCGDHYCVYQGKIGKVPLKNTLLRIQGVDDGLCSPNPIAKVHAERAIQFILANVEDVPYELRQKLDRPDVVVLGIGIHPLGGMKDSAFYDPHRVFGELNERLDLTDEEICEKDACPKPAAVYLVSNLILAYGVMQALGMDQVQYVGTQGANAVGTLLSPKYWGKEINK